MSNTFTAEHRATLEKYLTTHELPSGLGNEESDCSIAAINLALTGELTDNIPDCMSKVLGKATIELQDAMPDGMRNSERYKRLLPDMAGTGRSQEQRRLKILIKWMWETVLPQLQPIADTHGFSSEWQKMCSEKTLSAARAASARACAADAAYFAVAYAVTYVASASASARAADVAYVAVAYAAYADAGDFWEKVDPVGVLEKMTYLKGQDDE